MEESLQNLGGIQVDQLTRVRLSTIGSRAALPMMTDSKFKIRNKGRNHADQPSRIHRRYRRADSEMPWGLGGMVCRNGRGFSRAVLPDKRHRGRSNATGRPIWVTAWPIAKYRRVIFLEEK